MLTILYTVIVNTVWYPVTSWHKWDMISEISYYRFPNPI